MKKRYVILKSQLTENMQAYNASGCRTYRTRTECDCTNQGNRRNAILVIDGTTNEHTETIIRCRGCANREGGQL